MKIFIINKKEEEAIASAIECFMNENCVCSNEYEIFEKIIEKLDKKIEDYGLYISIENNKEVK